MATFTVVTDFAATRDEVCTAITRNGAYNHRVRFERDGNHLSARTGTKEMLVGLTATYDIELERTPQGTRASLTVKVSPPWSFFSPRLQRDTQAWLDQVAARLEKFGPHSASSFGNRRRSHEL